MTQPPLDPNDPSVLIALRVTAKMAARFRDEARRAGTTVSAFLRGLIDAQAYNATRAQEKEQEANRVYALYAAQNKKLEKANALYAAQVETLEARVKELEAAPGAEAYNASLAQVQREVERLTRANKSMSGRCAGRSGIMRMGQRRAAI